MRHGEVRNWRIEATQTIEPVAISTLDGQPLGFMPDTTGEQSVSEKWCSHCQKWVDVKGVDGAILFITNHSHGNVT